MTTSNANRVTREQSALDARRGVSVLSQEPHCTKYSAHSCRLWSSVASCSLVRAPEPNRSDEREHARGSGGHGRVRKGHVDNRLVLDFRKRRPGSRRPARSAPRREREAAICSGRTGDYSEPCICLLRVYYKLKLKLSMNTQYSSTWYTIITL